MLRGPFPILLLLGLATLALAGCRSAAVVGSGAVVATAASEERGLVAAAKDTAIRLEISGLLLDYNEAMFQSLHLNVVEGRVLITGIVPSRELRLKAVTLATRVSGVREVIDEIQVRQKYRVGNYAEDVWIKMQLVTAMLLDKHIQSINYSVETVDGIVYLIGIAQNGAEFSLVLDHARNIAHVKKIVSHVMLKDDPRRRATAQAAGY